MGRELLRLRTDRVEPGLLEQVDHVLDRQHPDHGRRAGQEPADAPHGHVVRAHQERVGVAHPALDRLGEGVEVARGDVAERRRAGTAVEVLVGAPGGQVDAPGVELGGDDAGGVTHVEEHERAGVVGDLGDRRDVGQPGGAVGDVVDRHQGGLLPHDLRDLVGGEAGRRVDVDPAEGHPALLRDAHRDVAVGREVVAVDHDLGAPRAGRDGGAHELVEQHGRGVTDGDLAGSGAQTDAPEIVAEGERQVEPALVPATDQPDAPLVLDEGPQPLAGGRQRSTERVAVEVDQRGAGPHEALAVGGERVGVVHRVAHAASLAARRRAEARPRTTLTGVTAARAWHSSRPSPALGRSSCSWSW